MLGLDHCYYPLISQSSYNYLYQLPIIMACLVVLRLIKEI